VELSFEGAVTCVCAGKEASEGESWKLDAGGAQGSALFSATALGVGAKKAMFSDEPVLGVGDQGKALVCEEPVLVNMFAESLFCTESVLSVLGVENVFCAKGTERSGSAGLLKVVVFGWKLGKAEEESGAKESEEEEEEESGGKGGKLDVDVERGGRPACGEANGAKEGKEGEGGRVERVNEVVKMVDAGSVVAVDRGVYDAANDWDWAQTKKESKIDKRESILTKIEPPMERVCTIPKLSCLQCL